MSEDSFLQIPNRDAAPVIAGFLYQIELTVLRWLELENDDQIEIECGEDIDLIAKDLDRPSSERRLEQVKRLTGRLTLRSTASVAFVANSASHARRNPDLMLSFLFTTCAEIGTEKPNPIPDRTPALVAWRELREGKNCSGTSKAYLDGIRSILMERPKPGNISQETWTDYCTTIEESSDEELLDFIKKLEWSTSSTQLPDLRDRILGTAVSNGHCPNHEHALELYYRLVVCAFHAAAGPPPRILQRQDVVEMANLPTLSPSDRRILRILEAADLPEMHRKLDALGSQIGAMDARLEQHIESMSADRVLGRPVIRGKGWEDSTPPLVQQLADRTSSINAIMDAGGHSVWINLHGTSGTGKTQLAAQWAQQTAAELSWVSLRNSSPDDSQATIEELASYLSTHLLDAADASAVVLDDLPDLQQSEGLSISLINLIQAIRDRGRLVTTSYFRIPPSVIERLPAGSTSDQSVPQFSIDETNELFALHGAPATFLGSHKPTLLRDAVEGHPILLTALARTLQDRGWASDGALPDIFKNMEEGSFVDGLAKKMLDEIGDPSTRDLLHRLSLVDGAFDDSVGERLASDVEPPIDRYRERIVESMGLWVERQSGGKLSISPMVRPLSKSTLPFEQQSSTYGLLADNILAKPIGSVFAVLTAINYLFSAQADTRAFWVMAQSLMKSMAVDERSGRLLLAVAESPRAQEARPGLAAYSFLLGQRLRAHAALSEPILALVPEVTKLVDSIGEQESWILPWLALNSLSLIAAEDFSAASHLARAAFAGSDSLEEQLSEDLDSSQVGGVLIWALSIGVSTPGDLREWMNVLAGCPEVIRRAALSLPGVEAGVSGLLDSTVDRVLERRQGQEELGEILDEAIEIACEKDLPILYGCSLRARFLLKAGQGDGLAEAIADASETLSASSLAPMAAFALKDAVWRCLLDQRENENGIRWLSEAVAIETDAYPYLRWHSLMRLSEITYRLSKKVDREHLRAALVIAEQYSEMCIPYARERTLTELCIAEWLEGDHRASYSALANAAEALLFNPSSSVEWKVACICVQSTASYVSPDVALGEVPSQTITGEPFLRPYIGVTLNFDDRAAGAFREDRIPLLFSLLAMFAEGVGDPQAAGRWAIEGLERSREVGIPEGIATSAARALPTLIAARQYAKAIDASLDFHLAITVRNHIPESEIPLVEPIHNLSERIEALPSADCERASTGVVDEAVTTSFLRLAADGVQGSSEVGTDAGELIAGCRTLAALSPDRHVLAEAAQLIELIFQGDATADELLSRGSAANREGAASLAAIAYFGATLSRDAKLGRSAIGQALAAHYLYRSSSVTPEIFLLGVLPFVEAFWRQAIAAQAFRFRTPRIAKKQFEQAFALDRAMRVQGILDVAISSLHAHLPEGSEEVRAWLAAPRASAGGAKAR